MMLTLRSMRYVYVQNFVTEWIRYFVEIRAMQQMVAASYARAAGLVINTATTEQLLSVRVALHSPFIVVPRSYDSADHLLLDLGVIHMDNQFGRVPETGVLFTRTQYSMAKMNMVLVQRDVAARILRDTTLLLTKDAPDDPRCGERGLSLRKMLLSVLTLSQTSAAGPLFPETRWRLECSSIDVVLSQAQASCLFATVRENLVADAQNEDTRTAFKDFQVGPSPCAPPHTFTDTSSLSVHPPCCGVRRFASSSSSSFRLFSSGSPSFPMDCSGGFSSRGRHQL